MQHLFSVEMFNFCPVWVKMLKSCKISARLKVEYFNTRWRLQFIWILWHKMLDQRIIWSQKIDGPSILYEDNILDFFETPLWRQFFPVNRNLATPFPLALCYHFYYIVTQEKKVQSMIFFISQLLGHIFWPFFRRDRLFCNFKMIQYHCG